MQWGCGVFQLCGEPYAVDLSILAVVALRHPGAVVCLISALRFCGITTQGNWQITIAVPRGAYTIFHF